jgi:hypothetical protein
LLRGERRFRLTGVRAGVVGLMAHSHGHASGTPEEVALGIGEQVSGVELRVIPKARSRAC